MEKNKALTCAVIPLLWRGTEGEAKAPWQTGYNSDWSNNATKIEALGVNHIEMMDNDKIKDILNRIFDGLEGDRSFFPTARR